ncbi:NAD(P)-dependent oxidoreductase [Sinorhizobium fredii]|uniref:NAD(P)-dependent oxidoreductase n=1 Tax=Rhizobium fredii TaxID=380 RepID=UPI0004B7B0FA|nr:NAD(P)-dependent oxidoreductase [Sinorhizobium fredii]AWM26181.1 D-3-phosphoglycerate dehydrogenase [Sinorhizobium fredii CCBAU 25509]MQW93874.1 phosphoglycerate dehydrogenase [Sinorhizobium fredii]UTY50266.1 phosphoglycerate dehydrogenase [Sinorhizobium fredii]
MISDSDLFAHRLEAMKRTEGGAPSLPTNPFFGVGPITDATTDEVDSRLRRYEFDKWIESTYRKYDDTGKDIGAFTTAELSRSMHRGYPADKILLDMMRAIHRYFAFPKSNRIAVGLGGGHSGYTVCVQHLLNANDASQRVYVDTPRPESDGAGGSGFFRQSWATQLIEMHRFAEKGDESRIHFAKREGAIPSAKALAELGVSIFIGVGHETTGANSYTKEEIAELLAWLDADPENRHAVFDATSMLGAMPWEPDVVRAVMAKCCLFMPFQKAIGGISGYFVASFTPAALALIERNQSNPSWAIPRQLKIAPPINPRQPFSSKRSVDAGPFYDAEEDKMLGGVINTYSALAFAETTFGLLQTERRVGSVDELNKRSAANRRLVNEWVDRNRLFGLVVEDEERRGAAVTLLKVNDGGISSSDLHARIIARSKQILGYEGITHPNGIHEKGLDAARYVNAFPGTPGDYRAWIGGIRDPEDVIALLENLKYAYLRAKIVVIEEELESRGSRVEYNESAGGGAASVREGTFKVLIADAIGLRFNAAGGLDHSELAAYIHEKGGVFHENSANDVSLADDGKIHFFYRPQLSTADDILAEAGDGQYDAVIAAATFIPQGAKFRLGGVRIGTGTGNMGSASWGGPNGEGGEAPLMNTPGINSRATAQMAVKALLKVLPDLPVEELHARVIGGDFDTGKNLAEYPTEKLEGKRIAILGYGNIGRELARLAKAFHMDVVVYARPAHRDNIIAEGYEYAASPAEAARGSDVLSVHLGLGKLDPATGTFSNTGVVDAEVLADLKDKAVLINYDRGELLNVVDLDAALTSGKVRHAAIDADIFKTSDGPSGPMKPYLSLLPKHAEKLELLPHAAADTDHPTRVAGAKQAVDQIVDAIRLFSVTNLKGDLPDGYASQGARTPSGIGPVTRSVLNRVANDKDLLVQLRDVSEKIAAILGALDAVSEDAHKARIVDRYRSLLAENAMRQGQLLKSAGLVAPAAKD